MSVLFIDFETRSEVDLRACGSHVYANDSSTDFICMGYAFDDEEVQLWRPGETTLDRVMEHVKSGKEVVGHNVAGFEILLWNSVGRKKYSWPELKIEQVNCTMARAYAQGLPGSLEKAAAAIGIEEQKDMKGNRVMLQLSQPKAYVGNTPIWYDEKEHAKKYEAVYEYCKKDVSVERELHKRLMQLSGFERKVFELDYRINSRGIGLDEKAAKAATAVVEKEKDRLQKEIFRLTKGAVSTYNSPAQIRDWIQFQGFEVPALVKADVVELLARPDLPKQIREVLELRQMAAKTSVAKVDSMLNSVSTDGRIRGVFQYHGTTTGRWAGRRIQPQNFPRPKLSQTEIDEVFSLLKNMKHREELQVRETISVLYGNPLEVISDCLRGFLVPKEGNVFIGCDFSAIEARVLAWLAGEDFKLKLFESGEDPYKHTAAAIFSKSPSMITKQERNIGKVADLALGYQGGSAAFLRMGKVYGVDVSGPEADNIKVAWRTKHKKIVDFWEHLDDAAMAAVRNPGTAFATGYHKNIVFKKSGSFLWCRLPSKRVLCYPYPKIEIVETPWGGLRDSVVYLSEDALTKKFVRHKAYGGLWAENITQAVARDLLVEAMFRLEAAQYPIVMHVHDEVVCEIKLGSGSLEDVERIAAIAPEWAQGLPLKGEGFVGKRYQK